MWRPGKGPGIVFAENQEIDKYSDLRDDFIHRILQLEWAWISDESSLWDFHEEEDNQKFHTRISLLYGVETSDVQNANILAILQRIAASRNTANPFTATNSS